MNHALWTGVSVGVIMALSVVTANAFTLTGKVSDDGGKAVQDADVSLVQKGLKAKTDTSGVFTIHQAEEPLALANKASVGFLSVNNGIRFALEHAAPDKEDLGFDARGVELACDNVQGGVGAALFATAAVKQDDFHDKLRCGIRHNLTNNMKK